QSLNPNEEVRTVARIVKHPDYNNTPFNNDVCLLQLSAAVTFTDYIRPVCLAPANLSFPAGMWTWVTGWGAINSGPLPAPQRLQHVMVPVVSNRDCRTTYSILTSNMICAGLTDGGKDSCSGDSGGPMVYMNGSHWVQIGVVSFGRDCALPNTPGVYARVSKYQNWISRQIYTSPPGVIVTIGKSSADVSIWVLFFPDRWWHATLNLDTSVFMSTFLGGLSVVTWGGCTLPLITGRVVTGTLAPSGGLEEKTPLATTNPT
ncbi:unnamed protein product, partial [Gadus morhua 'NCC']